jgi:hypothetical protein
MRSDPGWTKLQDEKTYFPEIIILMKGAQMKSKIMLDQSARYYIKVQGKLRENWSAYFEEMEIIILP